MTAKFETLDELETAIIVFCYEHRITLPQLKHIAARMSGTKEREFSEADR